MVQINPTIREYLSKIGKKGGAKSKRVLTKDVARQMVLTRELKRCFKRFHSMCFWSFDKSYEISLKDFDWIIENLKKKGNLNVLREVEKLNKYKENFASN